MVPNRSISVQIVALAGCTCSDGQHMYRELVKLAPRESEVARLIIDGKSNRHISLIMGIEHRSVRNYITIILRKLHVQNRTQLAVLLTRHGLGV